MIDSTPVATSDQVILILHCINVIYCKHHSNLTSYIATKNIQMFSSYVVVTNKYSNTKSHYYSATMEPLLKDTLNKGHTMYVHFKGQVLSRIMAIYFTS